MSFNTIAAISTPRGKGGVALIRISGDGALEIGDKIFLPKNKLLLSSHHEREAVFGSIISPDPPDLTIDEGLATVFRGPRSFTGEDTVEICCHGGVLVTAAVLSAAIAAGARQAEAGEFTRRAYAAGKMTLSEAEALGMLLDAKTDAQLKMSRGGLRGNVSRAASNISDEIIAILGDIYARVDFPDEDLGSLSTNEINLRMKEIGKEISHLSSTYRTGRAIADGISTVICGRTNTGKSTLYNCMTGEETAIVTANEGTTRDILTETVSFGGITLRLSDTAGIRISNDEVEKIGIDRAIDKINNSSLVLFLIDGTRTPDTEELKLAERLLCRKESKVIALLTKSDLTEGKAAANNDAVALWQTFECRTEISAKTGAGLDKLAEIISREFINLELSPETDAIIQNERQFSALLEAQIAVDEAISALADGFSLDVSGISLESALASLRSLDGRGVCADVVDNIFSKFCVGK